MLRKILLFSLLFFSIPALSDATIPISLDSQALLTSKYDATVNDSDKTWTVPDDTTWELRWAHAVLVSTATVGSRRLRLVVTDGNDVEQLDIHAGATQAASLTRHYLMGQGVYRETSFVDTEIHVPIAHDLILHPGWKLRFYDDAAIDAAADDLTVSFQVIERDN